MTENISKDSVLIVLVFNPLSKVVRQTVRIPAHEGTYEVKELFGSEIFENQVVPIPSTILKLPFRDSTALHELLFVAEVSKIAGFTVRLKSSKLEALQSSNPKGKFVVENSVSDSMIYKKTLAKFF